MKKSAGDFVDVQGIARSRWVFLVFHLLLLSYAFGAKMHVAATISAWFLMQVGIHAGYHRYFTHRSFRTSACFELLLGLAGCLAYQNGPIWWASKHRHHHQCADSSDDLHSPTTGFWHAHMGWLWEKGAREINWNYVADLRRPVPLGIEHYQPVILGVYVAALYLMGGWNGVLGGWVAPLVLCWHTTFSTNSFCHSVGTRPHPCHPHTTCVARNNFLVALVNLGEGWHNNHHANPSFGHHGFYRWYQLDIIYCLLLLFERFGLIWDLKRKKQSGSPQLLAGDGGSVAPAHERDTWTSSAVG